MKSTSLVLMSLLITIASFGQQPEYPDSGFTNKAEAKNLTVNGLKEGKWIEYFGNDVITNDTTSTTNTPYYRLTVYKASRTYGIEREYFNTESNQLFDKTPYVNGKRNGIRMVYSEKGKLRETTPFTNDKIVGIQKVYYEGGNLYREVPYSNGKENGAEKEYYESGKIEKEATWVNGKLIGIEKWYFENGIVKEECPYTNGKENGLEKWYRENGKLLYVVTYNNGYVGSSKVYDENGIEIINGTWKEYYDSGKIKCETPYVNRKKEGLEKEYYENGRLSRENIYAKDKLISTKEYDGDGNEIKQ